MSVLRLWPYEFEDELWWPTWPTYEQDWYQPSWGAGHPHHHHHHHHHRRLETDKWSQVVDMRGFTNDDITVNMDGREVTVHGKHSYQDGDNIDRMERKRKLILPSNVNINSVTTSLHRSGQLVLQAPLKVDSPLPVRDKLVGDHLVEAGNHDIFGPFPKCFHKEGDQIKLRMDVSAYKPEEIKVTVDNHCLKVHAKHSGERGYVESNHSILLPKGMDESALASTLSPEGTLTFSAPMTEALPGSGRSLTIEKEEPKRSCSNASREN